MPVVDPIEGTFSPEGPSWLTGNLFAPFSLAQAGGTGTTESTGAAPGGGEGNDNPEPPSLAPTIFMFVIIYIVFYLLFIRPQRRQQQDHRKLLAELKKNDEVRTSGGIFGKVSRVDDEKVTLVVDEKQNVKIQVLRASIVAVIDRDGVVREPAAPASTAK